MERLENAKGRLASIILSEEEMIQFYALELIAK
jgi:hypothetical protein